MSTPTNEQRADEIRARLAAATPGPWEVREDSNYKKELHAGSIWAESRGYWIAKIEDDGPSPVADAEFIANAFAALSWLLSRIEELAKERDAMAVAAVMLRGMLVVESDRTTHYFRGEIDAMETLIDAGDEWAAVSSGADTP